MSVEELLQEIENLKKENIKLKENLKKYTAPTRSKKYYDTHRDKILEQKKEYLKKKNANKI
jgi:hypothetical protein